MKKTTTVLSAILFSLTLATGAMAAEGAGPEAVSPQKQRPPAAAVRQGQPGQQAPQFDNVVGRNVVSPRDDVLGKVRNLIIDPQTGRVEFVVVSTGGFFGFGDERVIPWRALRVQAPGEPLVLDMTEQQLRDAPQGKDLANRDEVRDLLEYYGVSPYWKGQGAPAAQPERGPQPLNRGPYR